MCYLIIFIFINHNLEKIWLVLWDDLVKNECQIIENDANERAMLVVSSVKLSQSRFRLHKPVKRATTFIKNAVYKENLFS